MAACIHLRGSPNHIYPTLQHSNALIHGEAVVRISLDADTAKVSRCQCCLRCVTKCIWCFGAAGRTGHWLVLVITYLLVIFAIVVVVITVFLLVFLALV